jgi:GNAT superfamily N-acetyltransferase
LKRQGKTVHTGKNKGADGDAFDVFIGPNPESELVFIVDQVDANGRYDESKALVGWTNARDAKQAYMDSYSPGWKGFSAITAMPMDRFKNWLKEGDKTRPISHQAIHFAKDAHGHEHLGKGPHGGEFTGPGNTNSGNSSGDLFAHAEENAHKDNFKAAHAAYHQGREEFKKARKEAYNKEVANAKSALANVQSHAEKLTASMDNVAWDSDKEEHQPVTELETLISDFDSYSPADQFAVTKDIERLAKAAKSFDYSAIPGGIDLQNKHAQERRDWERSADERWFKVRKTDAEHATNKQISAERSAIDKKHADELEAFGGDYGFEPQHGPENMKMFDAIIESAKDAREALRTYNKHRKNMQKIKDGDTELFARLGIAETFAMDDVPAKAIQDPTDAPRLDVNANLAASNTDKLGKEIPIEDPEWHEQPDLSDEDERILEEIWKEIRDKKNAEPRQMQREGEPDRYGVISAVHHAITSAFGGGKSKAKTESTPEPKAPSTAITTPHAPAQKISAPKIEAPAALKPKLPDVPVAPNPVLPYPPPATTNRVKVNNRHQLPGTFKGIGIEPVHEHRIAGWTGANNANVELTPDISTSGRHYLGIKVDHPQYKATREAYRGPEDDLRMRNIYMQVDPKHQGKGIGTNVFREQVQNLVNHGFKGIDTVAAGEQDQGKNISAGNGHLTWPKLGYNGDVPNVVKNKIAADPQATPEQKNAATVQNLLRTPGGWDMWHRHGSTFFGQFDLTKGSQSLDILNRYLAKKGLPPIKHSGDETPEQEAALSAVNAEPSQPTVYYSQDEYTEPMQYEFNKDEPRDESGKWSKSTSHPHLSPVHTQEERQKAVDYFKPHLEAMSDGDMERVWGWTVRKQGPDKYRIETDTAHVTGNAHDLLHHLAMQWKLQRLEHGRILPALARAEGHVEPDMFEEPDRAEAEDRAFAAIPAGEAVVSLHPGSFGRLGEIVHHDGSPRVKLEGEAGWASNHVEPLNVQHSWRHKKMGEPEEVQGMLFSKDAHGHEHKGKGPGGGEFTGEHQGIDITPASLGDMNKSSINLWHGTTLEAAPSILKSGKISEGSRGKNAAANAGTASQYPEETGAQALVLLRANPKELTIDPNDQQGETVEDGLFPSGGFGSSCTLGGHRVIAVFDLEHAIKPDDAIKALDNGDLAAAIKYGLKFIGTPK